MSIANLKNKIKDFGKFVKGFCNEEIITVFIIIFVGLAGFGLGRLSITEEKREPVKIQNVGTENLPANVISASDNTNGLKTDGNKNISSGSVVASKNGTKYHYPWCSGAKSINEANKIYFASIEEAKKAGYEPASNCKGLK